MSWLKYENPETGSKIIISQQDGAPGFIPFGMDGVEPVEVSDEEAIAKKRQDSIKVKESFNSKFVTTATSMQEQIEQLQADIQLIKSKLEI